MAHSGKIRRQKATPHASVLIESMRDIGYRLETAVADIIDNSVTAGAHRIELLADTISDTPTIGILDDGVGMTEKDLMEAMRLGTKSPRESRASSDLGRFGLGLKTASFSQCRRLTVITCKAGSVSCAIWDLDTVAESDEWLVEIPRDLTDIPWADRLVGDGTLVIWEKLDRLIDSDGSEERQNLVRQIDVAASHVEFVFHRYLSGTARQKGICMLLNGRPLEAFDPFHSQHPATQHGQVETFRHHGQKIQIEPVTLPHHDKVSVDEWKRYAGSEGYVKNQGFYLYRNRRLIVHGTWFGLAKQKELTKLARVRIDIPNSLDAEWKIDVKKASAQPPLPVRNRLRRIIESVGVPSRRTYGARRKLATDNRLPVWTRMQDKNRISYGLNSEHPLLSNFARRLNREVEREFAKVIDLIVSTLPIDALFADISEAPGNVEGQALDRESFIEIVKTTYLGLREAGISVDEVKVMMSSAEPYCSKWQEVEKIINKFNLNDTQT